MRGTNEIAIELHFDRRADGRYYVHSPNVPGLHLAGMDLAVLRADVEPAVKDLLLHNRNIAAEAIRWVPSLDDVEREFREGKATYVVTLRGAA